MHRGSGGAIWHLYVSNLYSTSPIPYMKIKYTLLFMTCMQTMHVCSSYVYVYDTCRNIETPLCTRAGVIRHLYASNLYSNLTPTRPSLIDPLMQFIQYTYSAALMTRLYIYTLAPYGFPPLCLAVHCAMCVYTLSAFMTSIV